MNTRLGLLLAAVTLTGCAVASPRLRPPRVATERAIRASDRTAFAAAARQLAAAEREGWSPARCETVAAAFEDIARTRGFAAAWFDAGLARTRCRETAAGADELFQAAVRADPHHAPARVQLAVAALRRSQLEEAERWLRAALVADPQSVEASVNYAILRRRRGAPGDLEAAELDLRRALAVDARSAAAFDELAQVYLATTADRPGSVRLAAIVCRQAAQIDPGYAPLHNTCGLVQLRQGNVVAAIASFERALVLDPSLYEAAMNLGALAGSYRGYSTARDAFASALRTRPRSYDAHVGLGVALRGLDALDRAAAEYRQAVQIDEARPEAYFNLAILHQDFRQGTPADLQRALRCLDDFTARAPQASRPAADLRRRNLLDALAALGAPAQPAPRCVPD